MIRGSITSFGGPSISPLVSIPEFGSYESRVTFLLDTGASFSIVHPKDWRSLGVLPSDLAHLATSAGRGIGGSATYALVDARLLIQHTDGDQVAYLLPLHLAI